MNITGIADDERSEDRVGMAREIETQIIAVLAKVKPQAVTA